MKYLSKVLAVSMTGMLSVQAVGVWAAPDAELFGQLPQAHDAAISPTGKELAIIQNFQGQYIVNFIDLDADASLGGPRVVSLGEGVSQNMSNGSMMTGSLSLLVRSIAFKALRSHRGFFISSTQRALSRNWC